MTKHKYSVGDKVWLKAHKVLKADDTYDYVPRIKSVVTELCSDKTQVPGVKFYRIVMLDAPDWYLEHFSGLLSYTSEGQIKSRRR
jgi:hypothetical protein